MDKDLWPVIERAKKEAMYISIATNGTLITKEVAKRIANTGVDYVEISVDSIHPEIHDEFRGTPGAWKRTIEGIKNIAEEDSVSVGLAPTITKMNFNELEDLIKLAKDLKVDKFFCL